MKNEHIISILESAPFDRLSRGDVTAIEAHVDVCADCHRAYEASRVSAALLKESVAETFEPSPFFHTRVLAAWRERQEANEKWALRRMWQAAGALVSTMTATVALLAVLSFLMPGSQLLEPQATAFNNYSAEDVILYQNDQPDDQQSDAQVLETLDNVPDNAAR